jgi:hypothetical protein
MGVPSFRNSIWTTDWDIPAGGAAELEALGIAGAVEESFLVEEATCMPLPSLPQVPVSRRAEL